jgi:2-polyprenyl-6-methoxyphenol hydroxylase-like FAD-dependent oxidoreductase
MVSLAGSRVAVVGGSIAGCAAAIALSRAGCDVTVYERTNGVLHDRGFGIGIPAALHDELVSAGYLDADTPVCPYTERVWRIRDGNSEPGRLLAVQRMPAAAQNWATLWPALRAKVPDSCYLAGTPVTSVHAGHPRPYLTLPDGRSERFDAIIGADGYQSITRGIVAPSATLVSSGYGLWRGTCQEDLLSAAVLGAIERYACTIVYPGGHSMAYLIPDHNRPGKRLLNWAVYIVPPVRLTDFRFIPPEAVDDRLFGLLDDVLTHRFPALWAEVFRLTGRDRISVQPIYDLATPAYAGGRIALIGDAGALARPHTASGATTALQDALALERWCRTARDWDDALDGYSRERCPAGNAQTELGRILGRAQVTSTPKWDDMVQADFERWWNATIAGRDFVLSADGA